MTTEQNATFGETETTLAGAESTEAEAEAAEAQDGESETEPPDYKVLWETEQQDHAKTTNTLKSIQGNQRKADSDAADRASMRADITAMNKGIEVLMKGAESGETGGMSQQYSDIKAEAAQEAASSSVVSRMNALQEQIMATVPDGGFPEGVDINSAPEYAAARELWGRAVPEGGTPDPGLGYQALTEAVRAKAAIELATARKEVADAKAEAKGAKKKALDDVGAHDLSLGSGNPGGGINLDDGKTSTQRIREGLGDKGLAGWVAERN